MRVGVLSLFALLATTLKVSAQGTTATEGALNLLLPIGARAVGVGEAVIAHRSPSEALWWNPAGAGAATRREVAVHHSQSFIGTGDALSIVVASPLLGVLGLAFDLLDYGDQDATVGPGAPAGTLLSRDIIASATYASMIGSDATAGITFKMVQHREDCSGTCPPTQPTAKSYAVDVGVQYDLHRLIPVTFGAALRNVGPPIQVNDSPQSDPLPRRLQLGVEYRYSVPAETMKDTEVRVELDVLSDLKFGTPRPRLGAEVGFQKRAFIRGGYVATTRGSENGGPSIGIGYATRAVALDLGRVLTGFSADAGEAPTHLSIRILF